MFCLEIVSDRVIPHCTWALNITEASKVASATELATPFVLGESELVTILAASSVVMFPEIPVVVGLVTFFLHATAPSSSIATIENLSFFMIVLHFNRVYVALIVEIMNGLIGGQ